MRDSYTEANNDAADDDDDEVVLLPPYPAGRFPGITDVDDVDAGVRGDIHEPD